MKITRKIKESTLLVLLLVGSYAWAQSPVGIYDIVFTSTWNAGDHTNMTDTSLPGGAHWSKLVGVNHNSMVTFFEVGQMASSGIEMDCESGINGQFQTVDVQNAIMAGNAQQYINGPDLGTAAGTMTITGLEVSEDFPLLSLFSMIAPSPDWLIAINNVELLDGSGNWKSSISIPIVYAYDAGTDTGSNYTSGDSDSNLPITIFNPMNSIAPFNGNTIGSIEITRTNTLGVDDVDSIENIKVFPNPVKDVLNISNKSNKLITAELYNVLGKRVNILASTSSNSITMNVRDLQSGVYILRLKNKDGESSTRKVIIE